MVPFGVQRGAPVLLLALALFAVYGAQGAMKTWYAPPITHPSNKAWTMKLYQTTASEAATSALYAIGLEIHPDFLKNADKLPVTSSKVYDLPNYKKYAYTTWERDYNIAPKYGYGNPFPFMKINYNHKGKPSPPYGWKYDKTGYGPYTKKHWEFSLYYKPSSYAMGISSGYCYGLSPTAFSNCHKPMADKCYPKGVGYMNAGDVYLWQGNHYYDFAGPEWKPYVKPFQQAVVFGGYNQEIIFIEAKLDHAFFLAATASKKCWSIAKGGPAYYSTSRLAPDEYCIWKKTDPYTYKTFYYVEFYKFKTYPGYNCKYAPYDKYSYAPHIYYKMMKLPSACKYVMPPANYGTGY